MLNFRKVFEYLFKSFDISSDTKLIEKYEKDGLRFIMIIKRHWIYGILSSWRVVMVAIIAVINSYLLLFSGEKYSIAGIIISIFLILNVFYWLVIIITYLIRFYHINGSEAHIEDIYTTLEKNKESDEAFSKFFNQTIFLLIVLVFTTVFCVITAVSGFIGNSAGAGLGVINVILIMVQLGLFYSYLDKMINLEMDFKIIVPNQIIFHNQRGVLGSSQTMNADKIKTINTKYSGLFGSFFNYGDIIILTEGDQGGKGEMTMDFTGNPTKTVKEINKVLNNDIALMEKDVNLLLKKFEKEIGVKDINSQDNKSKLRDFVKKNDGVLKDLYNSGDEETKREIKELYAILASN